MLEKNDEVLIETTEEEDDLQILEEQKIIKEITLTKYFFQKCINTFTILVSLFLIIYLSIYVANLAMVIEQIDFNPLVPFFNLIYGVNTTSPNITYSQRSTNSGINCYPTNTFCANANNL